jgi:hypothetical protein
MFASSEKFFHVPKPKIASAATWSHLVNVKKQHLQCMPRFNKMQDVQSFMEIKKRCIALTQDTDDSFFLLTANLFG